MKKDTIFYDKKVGITVPPPTLYPATWHLSKMQLTPDRTMDDVWCHTRVPDPSMDGVSAPYPSTYPSMDKSSTPLPEYLSPHLKGQITRASGSKACLAPATISCIEAGKERGGALGHFGVPKKRSLY